MIRDPKFMGIATVGEKGQFVVPNEARKSINLKTGDKLVILASEGKEGFIAVKPEVFDKMVKAVSLRYGKLMELEKDVKKEK